MRNIEFKAKTKKITLVSKFYALSKNITIDRGLKKSMTNGPSSGLVSRKMTFFGEFSEHKPGIKKNKKRKLRCVTKSTTP